jgi:retron-type reverse transcriptase
VSLVTPEKIRKLQRALYVKAKQEPTRRFHFLYDKVWRGDILAHAYVCCRANGGAPGVDGETFARIDGCGVERWLAALREEVQTKRYTPQPVRRVMIPKSSGVGQRPLGIPTIRDRVVQTAATLVLAPIFEADFDEAAYGYRPQRSALDAVRKVHTAIEEGHTEVVDADLSKYFDTIPHSALMRCIARRVSDGKMLHLLKMWLKAPVEETDERGHRRTSGGKKVTRGTPQGGVITPRTQKVTSAVASTMRGIRVLRTASIRRSRGDGNTVTDDDPIIANEHVLDHQADDALPLDDVKRVGGFTQSCEKGRSVSARRRYVARSRVCSAIDCRSVRNARSR